MVVAVSVSDGYGEFVWVDVRNCRNPAGVFAVGVADSDGKMDRDGVAVPAVSADCSG